MFVAELVTTYFANTEGPFQKAAQAEQGRRGSKMEIDDDPDIKQASKELELEKIRFQKELVEKDNAVTMFKKVTKYDALGVPPQYVPLFLEWQNREAAAALSIGSVPKPKPAVMPQSNVNVDEEMGMDTEDDDHEEQSADAPPPPSGAAPPINVDNMITVDIWLKENSHDVTKKQAQRVGNITSDLIKKKFPNEMRFKKTVDSTGYEHRHYDRSHACIIEEAYKIMMEEDEKAARQPAPAPAPAQKPQPATQEHVNNMWRGGRGQ